MLFMEKVPNPAFRRFCKIYFAFVKTLSRLKAVLQTKTRIAGNR